MPRNQLIKLIIFVVFLIVVLAVKFFTPYGKQMTIEYLQLIFEPMGWWGIALFISAFCVSIILQLPGIVFIGAAIPLFGTFMGPLVAYFGSLAAVIVSFYFARSMGGNALAQVKSKRIQNMLNKVEDYPIKTIFILRLVMWVAPPLNYALAFSKVTTKNYIWASALGLLIPISVMCLGYNWFFG